MRKYNPYDSKVISRFFFFAILKQLKRLTYCLANITDHSISFSFILK